MRRILKLSIPVSLESVFQMAFNLIDQVVVGLLGADAVAAVGLSNSIASIALLLYASVGVGAGVMVARAFARKDLAEVSQIASAGQALSGLLGLLTAFLLVTFSQCLLQLVGSDQKLAGSANSYFHLYAVSIFPMILSAVTSAVFRSLNDPRTPLIFTSAAVALNTLLGFVLVLGFGPIPSFGVAGAGFAALLSQSARCLALIVFLYGSKRGVRWVWPIPGSKVGATAWQTLALNCADRTFRGALGHEHVHLHGGIHPPWYHDASGEPDRSLAGEHVHRGICGFSARSRCGDWASAWDGFAAGGEVQRVAHDSLWVSVSPRAWFAVRGLEPVASRALSEEQKQRISR